MDNAMTINRAMGIIGACSPGVITGSEGEMERIHKFDEAYEFLEKQLSKQVPVAVELCGKICNDPKHPEAYDVYKCPKCNAVLHYYEKYCWNCGQAVKWE